MSQKKALLIAVNDYHPRIGVLKGCVGDAQSFHQMLVDQFGFFSENIICLYNAKAEREAILSNLANLISNARSGEVVVVYFSGHGTRLPSYGKLSGMDEAIVPFSNHWESVLRERHNLAPIFALENRAKFFIRDKEFKAIFDVVDGGVNITLIMDCCHSGDINRDLPVNHRFIEPPLEVQNEIDYARINYWNQLQPTDLTPSIDDFKLGLEDFKALGQKVILGKRFDYLNTEEKSILLAACSANETAVEKILDGRMRGVFTYYLLDALNSSQTSLSYMDVILLLSKKMMLMRQTPRLTCLEIYKRLAIFSSIMNQ